MSESTSLLTRSSLLGMLLMSVHHAQDVARGLAPPNLENLVAVGFLVGWGYAALIIPARQAGRIVILVASILAIGMATVHMAGSGIAVSDATGASFFFAWTAVVLCASGTFTAILAARALRASRS